MIHVYPLRQRICLFLMGVQKMTAPSFMVIIGGNGCETRHNACAIFEKKLQLLSVKGNNTAHEKRSETKGLISETSVNSDCRRRTGGGVQPHQRRRGSHDCVTCYRHGYLRHFVTRKNFVTRWLMREYLRCQRSTEDVFNAHRKFNLKRKGKVSTVVGCTYPDLSECTFWRKQVAAVKHIIYPSARIRRVFSCAVREVAYNNAVLVTS